MPRPRKILIREGGVTTEKVMADPNEDTSTEDRPSKLNRADRPKRVPINGYRAILDVQGKEPGWHYCWVSDYELDRYIAGLYEFVTHEVIVGDTKVNMGGQMGGKVSKPVGNGVTGFLMRCPQWVYDEDQASIQEDVDASERGLRDSLNRRDDGRYGEVKISQKRETY